MVHCIVYNFSISWEIEGNVIAVKFHLSPTVPTYLWKAIIIDKQSKHLCKVISIKRKNFLDHGKDTYKPELSDWIGIQLIDLWLYPVVMDILTSGKSETGKSSLRPRSKISHQSPFLGASRLRRGDWLLIFDLGLWEIFQSPISRRWGSLQSYTAGQGYLN